MTHDEAERLLAQHAALRLLRAVNTPLMIGFLHAVFVVPNLRALPASQLIAKLEDYLGSLRQPPHQNRYPSAAKDYLEDWASGAAILRKYYPPHSEEPEFDLTVGAEKALDWLQSLKPRAFAGAESRLMTLFTLLRALAQGAESDAAARVATLEAQKAELERALDKARAGQIEPLDATRIRERYFELDEAARRLLGDFRQVEENFRLLDQRTRETLTLSTAPKGSLLDAVFGEQDYIRASDQGKSFAGFRELLMSPDRQDELATLLDAIHALPPVAALGASTTVEQLPRGLLSGAERVADTASQLVAQLRRFLDDRAVLENRRILELAQQIERHALALREQPPSGELVSLDALHPSFSLPLARALFAPPQTVVLLDVSAVAGEESASLEALLALEAVDETELEAHIQQALSDQAQVSLAEIVRRHPPRRGVAEIVGYLALASRGNRARVDESREEQIELCNTAGGYKKLRLPQVIFVR